jgi:hypothetical protein
MEKKCPKCKNIKSLDDFYKDKRTPDGLYSICKKCHIEKTSNNILKKTKEKTKNEWNKLQPRCIICDSIIPFEKYYHGGRGKRPIYCSEKCAYETHRIYRDKNREKINEKFRESKKEYYHNVIKPNKRKYEISCKHCGTMIITTNNRRRYCCERCRINFYRNKKYNTDILYKIENNLRSRINIALKRSKKSKKTKELVGCSLEELKNHLESQFKEGMSWDNYAFKGWHIDHIIPCAFFNLEDPEEQKKCFHFTNLQPLWWYENIKKSDKIL